MLAEAFSAALTALLVAATLGATSVKDTANEVVLVLLSLLVAPTAIKWLVLLAVTAPLSVALGFPFPLGLYLFRGDRSHFLPWAWSLNGSFSVIATPLANVLAVALGYKIVLALSAALYALVYFAYPVARGENRI